MEQRERKVHPATEALAACLGQPAHRALLGYREPKERRADQGSQDLMASRDPEARKVTGVSVGRRGSEESPAGKA